MCRYIPTHEEQGSNAERFEAAEADEVKKDVSPALCRISLHSISCPFKSREMASWQYSIPSDSRAHSCFSGCASTYVSHAAPDTGQTKATQCFMGPAY